jgi:peptide/nickel transport system permease protein
LKRADYIIRKIAFSLLVVAAVVVFNFFLFRVMPGDPVRLLFKDPRMSKEAQARVRVAFGLDKPVWVDGARLRSGDIAGAFDSQFTAYVSNLLHGNMGVSFAYRSDVGDLVARRALNSVYLVLAGTIIAIVFGFVFGLISAWRRGSALDTSLLLWSLMSTAMPAFFLGIVLILLVGKHLSFGGMVSPGLNPSDGLTYWLDLGKHLALPALAMAIVEGGSYLLIMRGSVTDVLSEDYILTAKAKGLSTWQILRNHAARNAVLPMVTIIALNLGYAVAGSIQIETVFSWPGVGLLLFDSVSKQDYPVLQGVFLLIAISVVFANLLADLVYSALDPRVRVD